MMVTTFLSSVPHRKLQQENSNAAVTSDTSGLPSESDSLPDVFRSGDEEDADDVVQLITTEEKENLAEMIDVAVGKGDKKLIHRS